MTTPEILRRYLQLRTQRGTLAPAKLSAYLGYGERSSMLNMILNGRRAFPMDRIDRVAQFFGCPLAEDLIREARQTVMVRRETGGRRSERSSHRTSARR